MGDPSGRRMPPCVLRIRISLPPIRDGLHPIPAFCAHPNRSPEGRCSSISGVIGSEPGVPAALDLTSKIEASPVSKIFINFTVLHFPAIRPPETPCPSLASNGVESKEE